MSTSVLTIGIPTFNRPEMLPNALRSAINQTRRTSVIVTDNGDPEATTKVLRTDEFRHRDITHIVTEQPGAWPNWRAAARACKTKYFAWLQDDDVIRATYAERIIDVMDYFTDTNVWMARLACAYTTENGMPGDGNFPHVPMDMLHGNPARWPGGGDVLAATSYVTAWSLSPAQAYRVNDRFFAALEAMPDGAEMMIERLFPAKVALGDPIIFDPIIAGYWVQHGRMLHLLMNADKDESARQQERSLRCLDLMMQDIEQRAIDWQSMLANWVKWIRLARLEDWLNAARIVHPGVTRGPYLDRVIAVLQKPLDDIKRLMPPRHDWVSEMFEPTSMEMAT